MAKAKEPKEATSTEGTLLPSFTERLNIHFRSGCHFVLVPTNDVQRVLNEIKQLADAESYNLVIWDQVGGFNFEDPKKTVTNHPFEALMKIEHVESWKQKRNLIVMHDMHNFYFDNHDVRRAIRAASYGIRINNTKCQRMVIMVQPTAQLHPDLSPVITEVPFSLPAREELETIVTNVFAQVTAQDKVANVPAETRFEIVRALQGMTSSEARSALSYSLACVRGVNDNLIRMLESEKANVLRRTEVLSYIPWEKIPPIDDLGGYEELVTYAQRSSLAYTAEAEEAKLDMPKGVIVIGVPGSGKSLAAMAIASVLKLPMVKFDLSAVFNSLVGGSEARTREAIRVVSAMDGCVLMIDEADKAMSGALDASGDSGVTKRVLGLVLDWLAMKKDRTFVVMTMNRTRGLPPEMLRRGRFDQVYCVDLPTEEERATIMAIHLRKRGIDPAAYTKDEWNTFITLTDDFVGAEIEQAVIAARSAAFELGYLNKITAGLDGAKEAEQKVYIDRLAMFPGSLKTEAAMLPDKVAVASVRGVPTAQQLNESIAAIRPGRVAALDTQSIEEIRKFCADLGQPVSRARAQARQRALVEATSKITV